jgi:undecaprenyl-phosphate 4-deoxy-4-formamido-L-arabinose transferase
MQPSLSVIVPVHGGASTLPELVARLREVLPSCASAFEILLVNDASPDGAWRVIEKLADAHPELQGIDLMRNYGQHNALLCGIRAAKHDVVVTIDDDLQHRPEDIPALLRALAEDVDVVYGVPREQPHGLARGLASRITKVVLARAMGTRAAGWVSAFRVFRTRLRDAFAECRNPAVLLDVLLSWGTTRFAAVTVAHEPRREGRSGYTLGKLLGHGIAMVTGYTVLPLRFASALALLFMLFGFGYLALVVVRYELYGSPVQGWPTLASLVSLLSGTQLLVLGILGEYLGRVHLRLLESPPYAVRARTDAGSATGSSP